MNKKLLYITAVFSLFLYSCSDQDINAPIETPHSGKGNISFSINKAAAPEDVVLVKAFLSRPDFDTLKAVLNMYSDSSAGITFNQITAGSWHLKVNALNSQNVILYTGETNVEIIEDATAEVNLKLVYVPSGLGNVQIKVVWNDYKSLILQPGSEGKNAWIDQLGGGNASSFPYISLFIGQYITSQIHRQRAFIDFNLSSNLPAGAKIVRADLYLYYDYLDDTEFPTGHGGPAELVIKRITQSWERTGVRWNNQPAYTDANAVYFNTSGFDKENFKIDVTQLTQDCADNPASSFGYRIIFADEQVGGMLKLASCNNPDPMIRPKLEITYK